MLGILETEHVGYFVDRLLGAQQFVLGQVHDFVLYQFLGRATSLLLDEVAEIVGGEEAVLGEIFHGGQSFPLSPVACEIVVKQSLELGEHVLVHLFTGDELTVVEAHAVVEQQLDVATYQGLGVPVDGPLYLDADLFQAVSVDFLLPLRKVERLLGVVGEEAVALDFPAQCGSADEVGMEKQTEGIGLVVGAVLHMDGLSRGEARHGALLIVVGLPSVGDVATIGLFQEKGVDTIVECRLTGNDVLCLGHVDHSHERMEGLEAVELVVGVHIVNLDNLFHK